MILNTNLSHHTFFTTLTPTITTGVNMPIQAQARTTYFEPQPHPVWGIIPKIMGDSNQARNQLVLEDQQNYAENIAGGFGLIVRNLATRIYRIIRTEATDTSEAKNILEETTFDMTAFMDENIACKNRVYKALEKINSCATTKKIRARVGKVHIQCVPHHQAYFGSLVLADERKILISSRNNDIYPTLLEKFTQLHAGNRLLGTEEKIECDPSTNAFALLNETVKKRFEAINRLYDIRLNCELELAKNEPALQEELRQNKRVISEELYLQFAKATEELLLYGFLNKCNRAHLNAVFNATKGRSTYDNAIVSRIHISKKT